MYFGPGPRKGRTRPNASAHPGGLFGLFGVRQWVVERIWSELGDLNVGKKPRSSKPTAATGCALALLGGVPGPAGRPACQARGQAAGRTVHACGLRGQRADVEADAAESFPKQGLSPGHLPNVPVIWEDCKLKSLPPNEWS